MAFSSDTSKIVSPLEGNDISVAIIDRTVEILALPLSIEVNAGNLLAASVSEGDTQMTLTAGHGASAGDGIYLFENGKWYHAFILNVATNVIDIDSPLDGSYTTSAYVNIGTINLNVDGSSAVKYAEIAPYETVKWDITRIHVLIVDNAVMDSSTFGGITKLTKGIVLQRVDGDHKNIFNAKSNGDLALASADYNYDPKPPSGSYGFQSKHVLAGQDHAGAAIRLDAATNDVLRLVIQDDLTGLDSISVIAIGHNSEE